MLLRMRPETCHCTRGILAYPRSLSSTLGTSRCKDSPPGLRPSRRHGVRADWRCNLEAAIGAHLGPFPIEKKSQYGLLLGLNAYMSHIRLQSGALDLLAKANTSV